MRSGSSWFFTGVFLLLAVTLVAAAVTVVTFPATTTPGIVPSRKIFGMKYFTDLSGSELNRAPDMSESLYEYALVTADPAAFMHDAGINHEVLFGIKGTQFRKEALYRIYLVPVSTQFSPDAVLIVKNESGEFMEKLPRIKQYQGTVIGRLQGDVFFTVSDDVILGRITINGMDYFLDQRGPGRADGGKTIHILYRSDKTVQQEPSRTFESPEPVHYSLYNRDRNQSHPVHIQLANSTQKTGEEQFELAAGEGYSPGLLTGLGDGTYFVRFTIDGNRTSELQLIVPSGPGFLLNPGGLVTRADVIFIG
jgi:hypothetical protein